MSGINEINSLATLNPVTVGVSKGVTRAVCFEVQEPSSGSRTERPGKEVLVRSI
jgi:hypothetical protein